MKRIVSVAVLSAVTGMFAAQSQAATFTETGDAGELLSTAQVPTGTSLLEAIAGTLSGDADLFQISLTGGQTFSASTLNSDTFTFPDLTLAGPTPSGRISDPQLFLFDANGIGVYGNDDSFGTLEAGLPSGGFSPAQSGVYFLAISSSGYTPLSVGGNIFPNTPGVLTPTGPGGNSPLSGFAGQSLTSGSYTIGLTGAEPVPEPSSVFSTLAIGTLGFAWMLKRKLQRSQTSSRL